MIYILMTNPVDCILYLYSTSQFYVQQCGQLTGAAWCEELRANVWIWKCACAYITKNLLEDTNTASALTSLICILLWMKAICIRAESVLQKCVMGRWANLHIATSPLLHF